MPKSKHIRTCLAVCCVLGLALALAGCAPKKKEVDPFFETWKAMAEQSQGHTPQEVQRQEIEPEAEITPVEPERELPGMMVGSLDMRNANIVAVLRALGKIAGQSIMVSPKVEGLINVTVEQVPWDQIFKSILKTHGLTYEWEGDIIRVMTVSDMEEALHLDELRNRQALLTATIKIRYADAAKLQENLTSILTQDSEGKARGSVEVLEHTNSLVINAVRADLKKIREIIDASDKPTKQIRIKAFIVETSGDTARNLGVMWGGGYRRSGISGSRENLWVVPGGVNPTGDPLSGGAYTPLLGGGTLGLSNQGYFSNMAPDFGDSNRGGALALMLGRLGGNILEVQLAALQEDSKLNILSSPSITTLDNQTAVTENGEEVPYITIDEAGNTQVEWKEAVMRLEITPHLIDGENLKMNILVNKDEVDFTRAVSGNPLIIKKKTETTLVSRNGETIVISGLTRKRLSKDDAGIPGLQDVPGVGNLFKTTSRGEEMEEVLIFITPTVLDEWKPGEAQRPLEDIERDVKERQKEQSEDKG